MSWLNSSSKSLIVIQQGSIVTLAENKWTGDYELQANWQAGFDGCETKVKVTDFLEP